MTPLRLLMAPAVMAVVLPALWGCSSSADEDLSQWMADQRRHAVPKVTPISEPKRYIPLAYAQNGTIDPFSSQKLTQALQHEARSPTSSAALVAPELNRRKEPLEAFPLDAMSMVGSLDRGGERIALVKVDNLLYQVRAGNYLGQNFGRVMKIAENEITLREIVQDAASEWIERNAVLQLQENAK